MKQVEPPPPTANPLETRLGYRLRRLSSALMGQLTQDLAAIRLTPISASVLVLIDRNPGIAQVELGRMLGIKRANMTPLAADLERRELVRREALDRRSHGLIATENGQQAAAAAVRIMDDHERQSFAALTASQREMLRSLVQQAGG